MAKNPNRIKEPLFDRVFYIVTFIILLAILVPILLFGRLDNIYIQLMIVSTVWLGLIGGLDDYIKVFRHHKEGLKGRFKIVGQVGLGIIVGTTMCCSSPTAPLRSGWWPPSPRA